MSVAAVIGWGLALVLVALSFWIRRRHGAPFRRAARAAQPASVARRPPAGPKPSEALIWVESDGSARELTDAEKKFVDTEFSPFDGARPYIKSRYEQRDGWGEIKGFLLRRELPPHVPVKPAPPSSPPSVNTPETVAASIRELIQKHQSR